MKKIIKSLILSICLILLSSCEISTTDLGKEEDLKEELKGESLAVGIWHRPNVMGNETNLDGVKATLDTFQRCGINIVYLETIYHGMAMYKSSFLPYYTGFSGNTYEGYKDYLSCFVTEANKRGIEVHAWVEDFYVGIEAGKLVTNHPDWICLTAKGSTTQEKEAGYIFLDPANDEVTNFLINVYYELLNKNPLIKGLNLDYIRYPLSTKSIDTGYTIVAMKGFLESINYNIPASTTLRKAFDDALKTNYDKWTDYRVNKVTSFVKQIRDMVDKNFKNIILSTAIFPEQSESYEVKKQDFTTWLKNKYLDVVTPMAYYDDVSTLDYYLKAMVNSSNGTYCYTGISCIYHNLSSNLINEQIDKCLELSNGFVIFGSQKLLGNETYINLLAKRFENLEKHLPHQE